MPRTMQGYDQEILDNFAGGLNTEHPASVQKNEFVAAKNLVLNLSGNPGPRPGVSKRFAADFSNSPVLRMGQLLKQDGTTRLLIAAGTSLYADTPHILFGYDSQAEWETGGRYNLDTASAPGSVKLNLPAGPTLTLGASNIITLQPGSEGIDSFIRQYEPDSNKGTLTSLAIGTGSTASDKYRGLIKFTLPSISDNRLIDNAILQMYLTSANTGAINIGTHRITQSWNETDVTWNNQPQHATDAEVTITVGTTTSTWHTWDLTALTQAWHANTYTNFGVKLVATNEGTTETLRTFSSSDHGTASQRPKFAITLSPYVAGKFGQAILFNGTKITLPASNVIANALGSMQCYINLQRDPGTTEQFIFDAAGAANRNLQVVVKTNGKVALRYGTGAATTEIVSTTALSKETWYGISWRWSSAGVALFINGLPEASSDTAPSLQVGADAYLGMKADSTGPLDGLLDEFRISAAARTDAEMLADYLVDEPFGWDAYTTYLLHFDGNTNLPDERQGSWLSPTQNAATAADKSSLRVSWGASVPAVTALACQVRTSANGTNWSAWYDQVNGELSGAPANDYSQLRFLLQTVSPLSTPILDWAMVSYEGTPTATMIASGLGVTNIYAFGQMQDTSIIVSPAMLPRKYDGTTVSTILAGPRASSVCIYKNRAMAAQGTTLYFSDLLDLDSWPVDNWIMVNPRDGDRIMMLVDNPMLMLIAKERTTYYLSGYSPETFEISHAGDIGTISPQGMVWTPYGIFTIDREGIWLTDLRKRTLLSRKIQGCWNQLNQRMLDRAALFFSNDRLFFAGPGPASSHNNVLLVYDAYHKAWLGEWTGWNASCFLPFYERGKWEHLFGDATKGNVFKIGGSATDAGVPFNLELETAHLPLRAPGWEKRLKWCDVLLGVRNEGATVGVSFVADGVAGPEKQVSIGNNVEQVPLRFFPPAHARTIGARIRMVNTNANGPELMDTNFVYFPRALRPQVVV